MNLEIICRLIILLTIYSFAGWVYESTMYTVEERKFINRGFLVGPYCPIYGFGAVLVLILLSDIKNPIELAVLGTIVPCTLEYFTSWAMEALFHARWWDYTERRFNIKGRICLLGAVVFGSFSVLLIYVFQPFVEANIMARLSYRSMVIITIGLVILYTVDTIVSVLTLIKVNQKLEFIEKQLSGQVSELIAATQSYAESKVNKIHDMVSSSKLNSVMEMTVKKMSDMEKYIFIKFPDFTSTRYNGAVKKVKGFINNRRNKK